MWYEILKKDLMKRKGINLILFFFITLSTVFLDSSVSNIRLVMNGLENYMKCANVSDVMVVLGTEDEKEKFEEWLNSRDEITEYAYEQLCQIKAEEVALPAGFLQKNELNTGDELHVKIGDDTYSYRIAGQCKDIMFGNDMSENNRFVFCKTDYDRMAEKDKSVKVGAYSFNTENEEETIKSMNQQGLTTLMGTVTRSTYTMLYAFDMVLAKWQTMISARCPVDSYRERALPEV